MGRPPLHINFLPTMANRITNLGFPPNIFHPETYVVFGYMDKNIASLLRPLSPYSDDCKLERILLLGVKLNFFNSICNCQPNEFYKFLRHLRTSDGQVELQKLSIQEKLEKRAAAAGLTVHEMACIALAQIPMSDLWTRKNKIRKKLYESIIADHDQSKIGQQTLATFDCAEGGNPIENVPGEVESGNAGL